MKTFIYKTFAIAVLMSTVNIAFADRGAGKKNKTKIVLNIFSPLSLKSNTAANVNSGLKYRGSLLSNTSQTIGRSIMNTSIITYQKGNITYIVPYKYKVVVPEMKQGYTGVKLIIRSQK